MKTYRDIISPVQIQASNATNTLGTGGKFDSAAASKWASVSQSRTDASNQRGKNQLASSNRVIDTNLKSFNQNLGNIVNPLMQYLEVEATDAARRRGKVQAQEGLAEIEKLQESISKQRGQLSEIEAEYDSSTEGSSDYTDLDDRYNSQTAFLNEGIKADNDKINDLLSKGSAYNIQESVRSDIINEGFLHKLNIDIDNTVNELYQANINNPQALEEQAKQLKTVLKNVPAEYRTSVEQAIDQKIKKTVNISKENLKKKQLDELNALRQQTLTINVNGVTQDAYMGESTSITEAKIWNTLKKQVQDGSLSEVNAGNIYRNIKQDIYTNKIIGPADRITNNASLPFNKRIEKLQEYAENFLNTKTTEVDNTTKMNIYAKMMTKANSMSVTFKSAESAQNKVDIKYMEKMFKALTKPGKIKLKEEEIQRAKIIAIKNGKGTEFEVANTLYKSIGDLNKLPLNGQQEYIQNKVNFVESNPKIQGLYANEIIDGLTSQYENNIKMAQEDPNAYLEENPINVDGQVYSPFNLTKFTPQQNEDGEQVYGQYNDDVTTELAKRIHMEDAVEIHIGNKELISKKEAHVMQHQYSSMDNRSKINFLANLQNKMGYQRASEVITKMSKDNITSDLMAANIWARGTNKDANTARFMLLGTERRADKTFTKMPTTEEKTASMQITSKLLKIPNVALHKEAVMNYYYGKATNLETFDADLMEEAIENVVGVTDSYNNEDIFSPQEDYLVPFMSKITTNQFFEENKYPLPDNFESYDQLRYELGKVSNDKWFRTDEMQYKLEYRGIGKYAVKDTAGNYLTNKGKIWYLDTYIDNDKEKGARKLYDIR